MLKTGENMSFHLFLFERCLKSTSFLKGVLTAHYSSRNKFDEEELNAV